MRTSSQIYFDFSNARTQAARLDDLAARLERQAVKGMGQAAQSVGRAWSGKPASRYIQKGDSLKAQVSGTVSDLRSIAADIRRIAQAVYNAEMEALRIAQQRRS